MEKILNFQSERFTENKDSYTCPNIFHTFFIDSDFDIK